MKIDNNLYAFIWTSMTTNNCNTYLIDGSTRILIDPGHEDLFFHVQKGLSEIGLVPGDIGLVICTHAHSDHLEAISMFKERSTLFALHTDEWRWLQKFKDNRLPGVYAMGTGNIHPDFLLKEGELFVNGTELSIIHTPGHSPGSICIYLPRERVLFSGDLVFKAGIGRTDLPGGDAEQLKESIRKVSDLDIKWLLPGHGNIISSTKEVKANFDQLNKMIAAYL
jgi:glyoxylase-like metal-dependent hydrolase (beta-lactamase superfamily II)